jgi:hypothetical protein
VQGLDRGHYEVHDASNELLSWSSLFALRRPRAPDARIQIRGISGPPYCGRITIASRRGAGPGEHSVGNVGTFVE